MSTEHAPPPVEQGDGDDAIALYRRVFGRIERFFPFAFALVAFIAGFADMGGIFEPGTAALIAVALIERHQRTDGSQLRFQLDNAIVWAALIIGIELAAGPGTGFRAALTGWAISAAVGGWMVGVGKESEGDAAV